MIKRTIKALAILAFSAGLAAAAADEITGDIGKGAAFARANCVQCHAISASDESTQKDAPPLRELSARYPLNALYEAFAEGITVGHPDMPEFELEPAQINDLLSYILSIEAK